MKIEIDNLVNTGSEFCGYDITEIIKIITIINDNSCLVEAEAPSKELINIIENARVEFAAIMNILDRHKIERVQFCEEVDKIRELNK